MLQRYETEMRRAGNEVAADKALALRLEHGDLPLEDNPTVSLVRTYEEAAILATYVSARFSQDNRLEDPFEGTLASLLEKIRQIPEVSYAVFVDRYPGASGLPTLETLVFWSRDDGENMRKIGEAHSNMFRTLLKNDGNRVDSFIHHPRASVSPEIIAHQATDRTTEIGSLGKLIAIASFGR